MLVRTKSGDFRADNAGVLLDFFGIKKNAAGPQKVKADVELVASVPFRIAAGTQADEGFPWTLSTFDIDRYGERIVPDGWECANYLKNPVVCWAHRYDIPAIGKIETLKIDRDGLHGLVIFNGKDYDPYGWGIGQRVQAGVIRAGSVGFRVIEIEIPDEATAKDGTSLIFTKQELLEFSICNVPANPFALAKTFETVKSGANPDSGSPSFWSGLINNI